MLESWIAKREGGLGGIREDELHSVSIGVAVLRVFGVYWFVLSVWSLAFGV